MLKTNKRKGGGIIGKGGFGCVFSPALKCTSSSSRPDSNKYVSKLMDEDDADKEHIEILKVLDKVKEIPNYKKYTLLEDVKICNPDLDNINQNTDLEYDYKNKNNRCDVIDGIYQYLDHLHDNNNGSKNINLKDIPYDEKEKYFEYDSELALLQLPKGGVTIDNYLQKNGYKNEEGIKAFFKSMNDLLINFIVPMNKKGIYHRDLKSDNILINLDTQQPQLIDWGLAGINSSNEEIKTFESSLYNWGNNTRFSYNVPFSASFIYGDSYISNDDLRKLGVPGLLKEFDTHSVFKKYLMSEINSIDAFGLIYNDNELDKNPHFQHIWRHIIKDAVTILNKGSSTDIIENYVKNIYEYYSKDPEPPYKVKTFKRDEFIKDFYHNIDLYGWAISFTIFLEFNSLKNITITLFDKIKTQISKLVLYLFTNGTKEIDINAMTNIIEEIYSEKVGGKKQKKKRSIKKKNKTRKNKNNKIKRTKRQTVNKKRFSKKNKKY